MMDMFTHASGRRRAAAVAALVLAAAVSSGARASELPKPAKDIAGAAASSPQTAVFAGGCFWGVEAVFEKLNGVTDVVSGFAGGSKATAHYNVVSMGITGHAESVMVTYDPSKITYGRLLTVFFEVAHDPTQLNRQGPDEGRQYRSAIFYVTPEQRDVAQAYIEQLTAAKTFKKKIVTTVVPLEGFYPAEGYHQDFLRRNPGNPYIVYNDLPKLDHLAKAFPDLVKR
jgi:peptide-methionine (S)-S-oxide reductase